MNITHVSGVSPPLYTRGATLANQISGNTQTAAPKEAALASSYKVSLSSEGLNRSRARFESGQDSDLRAFERNQDQKEQAKQQELDAEKQQFDRRQTFEKRQFDAKQRMEAVRFSRQNP